MAQFDMYIPVASAAQISFSEVFLGNKKMDVLLHCKKEILKVGFLYSDLIISEVTSEVIVMVYF